MLFHPSAQAWEILEFPITGYIPGQVFLISSLPEDQGRPGSRANQTTGSARPGFDQVVQLQSQTLSANKERTLKSKITEAKALI